MDIFLGSLITLIVILSSRFFIKKHGQIDNISVRYSQSHIYELVKPFLPDNQSMTKPPITQSTKDHEKTNIRVVFAGNKAYWIRDNGFYVADVVDDEINEETAKRVDIMSMSKVELTKMILIVEKLTEGTSNDYWSTG
jgi:hypothetical protein